MRSQDDQTQASLTPNPVGYSDQPTYAQAFSRLQAAERIAHTLAHSPAITAVCVFGSVSRGDDTQESDIDLLVVSNGGPVTRRQLEGVLPRTFDSIRPVLTLYSLQDLKLLLFAQASFAAHLVREGRILFDRDGAVTQMFASWAAKPPKPEAELDYQLSRLRSLEDTSQFNGNFLFCLAQLYAIGKAIVMLRLAGNDTPEFNKDRAFKLFADRHPGLRDHVERVAELKPFYLQVTRRQLVPLPFSYRDAERATVAISAIRKVAEAS